MAFEILIAGFVACQPYECAYAEDGKPADKPLVSPTAQAKEKATKAAQEPHAHPPKWYAALKGPDWWLVIAAFLTCGVVGWQAWETRRAVIATTLANEAVISKERARLQIIAGPVSLHVGNTISITYYLKNIGPSTAFLDGGGINLIKGAEQITVDYTKCASMFFTGSVLANSPTENTGFVLIALPSPLKDIEIAEFMERKAFIHCYGYVRYRDVYDRPRQVRLHLRWFMNITQGWEVVGPVEENSDQ